jgi:hypothetical protein
MSPSPNLSRQRQAERVVGRLCRGLRVRRRRRAAPLALRAATSQALTRLGRGSVAAHACKMAARSIGASRAAWGSSGWASACNRGLDPAGQQFLADDSWPDSEPAVVRPAAAVEHPLLDDIASRCFEAGPLIVPLAPAVRLCEQHVEAGAADPGPLRQFGHRDGAGTRKAGEGLGEVAASRRVAKRCSEVVPRARTGGGLGAPRYPVPDVSFPPVRAGSVVTA